MTLCNKPATTPERPIEQRAAEGRHLSGDSTAPTKTIVLLRGASENPVLQAVGYPNPYLQLMTCLGGETAPQAPCKWSANGRHQILLAPAAAAAAAAASAAAAAAAANVANAAAKCRAAVAISLATAIS